MTTPIAQRLDPGPAPSSIRVVCWLAVALITFDVLVGLPLAHLSKDAVLAAMPETPGVDKEAIWQGTFTVTVVMSLGMAALWVLFAVKLNQGRNWARITMLVLSVLGLVFTPINLANGVAIPATVAPALIDMAVEAVIVILLVTEPAKSWTPAKTAFLKNVPF